jgi:heme/copper-type cytochrome/quinol oxidase subunit 2
MFDYELLRNRWVLLILFTGIAFILFVILYFMDLWKPRKMKEDKPDEFDTAYLTTMEGIPSTIKVIIVAITLFMAYYLVTIFLKPQSW